MECRICGKNSDMKSYPAGRSAYVRCPECGSVFLNRGSLALNGGGLFLGSGSLTFDGGGFFLGGGSLTFNLPPPPTRGLTPEAPAFTRREPNL